MYLLLGMQNHSVISDSIVIVKVIKQSSILNLFKTRFV